MIDIRRIRSQLIVPFLIGSSERTNCILDFFISMYDTLAFDRKKVKPESFLGRMLPGSTGKSESGGCCDRRYKSSCRIFFREFGADPRKIQVMYLEADKSIYYPHKVEKPEEQKENSQCCISAVFFLYREWILCWSVQSFKEIEDICFYIIGPIGEKMKKPLDPNIHYIQWLSQEKLSDYIAFSDLCLQDILIRISIKPGERSREKRISIMLWKKPMILGDNPATMNCIQKRIRGSVSWKWEAGKNWRIRF